jgi:hypothetical protein
MRINGRFAPLAPAQKEEEQRCNGSYHEEKNNHVQHGTPFIKDVVSGPTCGAVDF